MPQKTLSITKAAAAVERATQRMQRAQAALDAALEARESALADLRAAIDAGAGDGHAGKPARKPKKPSPPPARAVQAVAERGAIDPAQLRALHARGLNDVAIAQTLGVSTRRVQRMRSDLGLEGFAGRPKGFGEAVPPTRKKPAKKPVEYQATPSRKLRD